MAEYQNYLYKNNAIDFSDMINNAVDLVSSGCNILPYEYVIVDEYQDISKSRFNFLKAIADRTERNSFVSAMTGSRFTVLPERYFFVYGF